MKNTLRNTYIKAIKFILLTVAAIFCSLALAEHSFVDSSEVNYYEKLINRTDAIKVFYTNDGDNFHCNVEVVLNKMKWVSTEKEISESLLYRASLSHCLSPDSAKNILSQTFLEFGQGL